MRLAGIDIGTNTLRLLIVDTANRQWNEIYSERQVTRLGEGFFQDRHLSSPAIQRTEKALHSFNHSIRKFHCDDVVAIATSAVREAKNQTEFLNLMKIKIPLEIRVISGEEEARLTWLGICQSVSASTEYRVLIDIGGGSTEWIDADRQKILNKWSLPLGVVFLTEQFLLSDPPLPVEMDKLRERIRKALSEVKNSREGIKEGKDPVTLIGTAGTVTTLAAMAQELEKYSFERINGYILQRKKIGELLKTLISRKKDERRGMKGLEVGREDIIVAGAMILLEAMSFFDFSQLVVSDHGLREGIIIDHLQKIGLAT